jgi:uncharacterized protein
MFAFGKNKQLLKELEVYLSLIEETIKLFEEGIDTFIENGISEHFKLIAKKTHQNESNADDLRRQIELDLYKKSLLPESRSDLLIILEMIDKIPNKAETILNIIITQKMDVLDELKSELKELMKISIETVWHTIAATRDCFGKMEKIYEYNRLVDNNESVGDSYERKMVTHIFESDLDTGEKILQKELVLEFGAICDLCESALDRIVLCSVKRQV